jgi:branched-chain amino acid transport system substrate-binding protein
MRRIVLAVLLAAGVLVACSASRPSDIIIGTLYPTAGPQGPQGQEEQHGVELAAQWANQHGGINGHHLRLISAGPLDRPEAVPDAMASLRHQGVSIVVGSHGSEFSSVAADYASSNNMLLWETGAVGESDGGVTGGSNFIRMSPMGANLGKTAVDFVNNGLAGKLPQHSSPLRWAIAFVNDQYGRAVAGGAEAEASATGQPVVAMFPYAQNGTDFAALVSRIAAARPDVLYVSAYLADGTALRRALVAGHVPLLVNLGTSSSYCMPQFGQELGQDAVGVYASDKPDAAAVRTDALTPEGRAALAWVAPRYQAAYHTEMSAHALSGFSNAYALFEHVLPVAGSLAPAGVSAAALRVKLPIGSLANGGGMDIAPLGAKDAGNNRAAAGVVEEWVAPGQMDVVWPLAFATHPIAYVPIDR